MNMFVNVQSVFETECWCRFVALRPLGTPSAWCCRDNTAIVFLTTRRAARRKNSAQLRRTELLLFEVNASPSTCQRLAVCVCVSVQSFGRCEYLSKASANVVKRACVCDDDDVMVKHRSHHQLIIAYDVIEKNIDSSSKLNPLRRRRKNIKKSTNI